MYLCVFHVILCVMYDIGCPSVRHCSVQCAEGQLRLLLEKLELLRRVTSSFAFPGTFLPSGLKS